MALKLNGNSDNEQSIQIDTPDVFDMSAFKNNTDKNLDINSKDVDNNKLQKQGKYRNKTDKNKDHDKSKTLDLSIFENKSPTIDELLQFCTEQKCSDLYIKVGQEPFINRWGRIHKVPCFPISAKVWNEWAKEAITSENNAKYVRSKMLDLSYTITLQSKDSLSYGEELRYRVSAGFSMGRNIATFRMITKELPSFSTISFPNHLKDILYDDFAKRQGITLFVGVTGSGKTTTLAAAMNDFSNDNGPLANSTIISLEDPVEYIFPATINVNILQKELGVDFKTFADGIKQSLREHPNFVNVGETRDKETIEALVEGARTGHGVVSSFHASDVADTIARMYNMLIGQNEGIMYDVISNMNLVLCQQLVADDENGGFKLRTQYMIFNDKIKEILNTAISNGDNIPVTITKLFKNDEFIQNGYCQDWI